MKKGLIFAPFVVV
jgi:hypothetical protein